MAVLENLRALKKDMEKKGWCIDSFLFTYKRFDYIVLVKLYGERESKPEYALLKLEFIKTWGGNERLSVPANASSFLIEAGMFRHYFGIEYGRNLGDVFQQFYAQLAGFIPSAVSADKSASEKRAMVKSLSSSDNDAENRLYCGGVRRNGLRQDGSPQLRSVFNDNKTRLLRPNLYREFGRDRTLSFRYFADPADERSTTQIAQRFAEEREER